MDDEESETALLGKAVEFPYGIQPEGFVPVEISGEGQEIFGCLIGTHVTPESPTKLVSKEQILKDLEARGEESDFFPIQSLIADFPKEEVMLVYDAPVQFGENFFVCLSDEATELVVQQLIGIAKEEAVTGEETAVEEEEEEESYLEYVPPEPKEWIPLGSEQEVEDEQCFETRAKNKLIFRRVYREFKGRALQFGFRFVGDVKNGYVEISSEEDKNFNIHRLEMDKGIQAIKVVHERGAQTNYHTKKNQWTQYVFNEFSEKERNEVITSKSLHNFLKMAVPRFEYVIQQNEIHDVFHNIWKTSEVGEEAALSKTEFSIKEYQTFTDLHYSKNKSISSIDWHPSVPGIIAVACMERLTYDARIDKYSKLLMKTSIALLWSFKDPINPQLLLEGPDEIRCIKFNPNTPNIVAAGCINGQIALWDIEKFMDKLKGQFSVGHALKPSVQQAVKFVEETPRVPSCRYCIASTIEHSHKSAVEDIQWIPCHFEVAAKGVSSELKNSNCVQLMSCGLDCKIFFWDTRANKQPPIDAKLKKEVREHPVGIPITFQHLDLVWKPVYSIDVLSTDKSFKLMPGKMSLKERHTQLMTAPITSEQSSLKVSEGESDEAPEEVKITIIPKVYIGTVDGYFMYLDWTADKDPEGGTSSRAAEFAVAIHGGPIDAVEQSPFFKDMILTVGMCKLVLWKEELGSTPFMEAAFNKAKLKDAKWSPTKPSIFFVARDDGDIDIWNLLDRTHEPIICHTVSAISITAMAIYPGKEQMLAAAVKTGTIHLLQLPPQLTHIDPGEMQGMQAYIDNEVRCIKYRQQREIYHANLKAANEREAEEQKQRPQLKITSSDEEEHQKQQADYNLYLEIEKRCLVKLGILEEDILPSDD